MEAAIRLFVDQGFDNTPTSQISKAAGVATGTLFNYFKTKEDLINHAFLHSSQKVIEYITPNEERNFEKYLRDIWYRGMNWALNNQYYVKFMMKFSTSVYISKLTLDSAEEILTPYYDYMSTIFQSDSIKPLPHVVLINTYNNIFSVFFNYLIEENTQDERIIEQGFSVVWDALKQ